MGSTSGWSGLSLTPFAKFCTTSRVQLQARQYFVPDELSKAEGLFCATEGLWYFLELDLQQANNRNILFGDHDNGPIRYADKISRQHPQMTGEVVTTQGLYRKELVA